MKPINPLRRGIIKGQLLELNPVLGRTAPFKGWEMSWTYATELQHHAEYLEQGLHHIVTSPLTPDMPPAARALVQGLQEIARRYLNGE